MILVNFHLYFAAVYNFTVSEQPFQIITKSLGPHKLPCYRNYLVLQVVENKGKKRPGTKNYPCYTHNVVLTVHFLSVFACIENGGTLGSSTLSYNSER